MHKELERANKILAERFEKVAEETSRPEATEDLRAIISIGIDKVLARTTGKTLTEAQRLIVNEVRSGSADKLAYALAADVQDIVKERSGKFMLSIQTEHGLLKFLPDVSIEESVPEFKKWQAFLNALDGRCLRIEDQQTKQRGRIPYREGAWNSDLIFKAGTSASITEDVHTVRGNLMIRGNEPDTSHTVIVQGDIYIDYSTVRDEPSFIGELAGSLRLYEDSIRSAQDITLAPEDLMDWGVNHNSLLHVNDRQSYRFHSVETPDGAKHALVESLTSGDMDYRSMRFVWTGKIWQRFHRELPPETAYAILKKFRRLCALMGLGDDYIIERPDAVQTLDVNSKRIGLLLDLASGKHSASATKDMTNKERTRILELAKDLERLRDLAVGEGPEYYRDMDSVTADIDTVLETLSDTRISSLHELIVDRCQRIDRTKLRKDRDYLKGLTDDGLTFADVLATGGRTLVFINNVATSPQIKRFATDAIAGIRETLKEILGTQPSKTLLTNLLKFSEQQAYEKLRTQYSDAGEAITTLVGQLEEIGERKPLGILREYANQMFNEVPPELEKDRGIFKRCLSLHRGTIDEVFKRAETGYGWEDGALLRNALAVNLRSFITERLAREIDLDSERPSEIVNHLLDGAERYRPAIPEFNRICARKGKR